MKKIYIISFLLILSASNILSQSGWFWQNPLPQGNDLNSVKMYNNYVYVAGIHGTLLKSTNSGANWINSSYIVNTDLKSVFFYNELTGWVSTEGYVMKTIDGGVNWETHAIESGVLFNSVFFLNALTGFTISEAGKIYKTINGGVNWILQYSNTNESYFNCFFLDVNTGWVIGDNGKILKTINGGSNWNNLISGVNTLLTSLAFRNSNTGWITTDIGTLLRTTNGGLNWTNSSLDYILSGVYFINDLTGWTAGTKILKTTNGGINWNVQLSPLNNYFKSIHFINDQIGTVVGANGIIYRTTNGGINWNLSFTSSTSNTLREIFFINEQSGWSAGHDGTILFTSNGGNNWNLQFSNTTNNFLTIRFINQNTGWVAGLGAYKTTNHGINWIDYLNSYEIYSIFPVDSSNVYASGGSGLLMRSTNGGNSWLIYPGLPYYFYDIFFINNSTGWVGGSGQIILKTTNSGVNWFNQRGGNLQGNIFNIHFLSEFLGFASTRNAGNNEILVTGNGGVSWSPIYSTTQYDITSIYFTDINNGWFVSEGKIYNTTNSGIDWLFQGGASPIVLNSLFFINNSTGWVTGENGSILKTTSGGTVIGIQNISNSIPEFYSLHQNFPNPFNPVSKIKFDIPNNVGNGRDHSVKIIIYDLLGREVTTLVNEQLSPGTYTVDWDGSAFASGVYFYSLIVNDPSTGSGRGYVETKRMVLIK